MFTSFTKKLLFLLIFLGSAYTTFAVTRQADSIYLIPEQPRNKHTTIDSLQQEVDAIMDDSLKAPIYSQIAAEYLKFDTVKNKKRRHSYENEAIKNTMSALHYYSRYDDTAGLRLCFDVLAKTYHKQRKYPQAKWFILQSNTLSRSKHDNLNIIASLIELSAIKSDIKDYKLAMRDLHEAQSISSKHHYSQQESEVQLQYSFLYNAMRDHTKASVALRRHNAIDNNIKRDEESKIAAKLKSKDSTQQARKKFYAVSNKRAYKSNSSRKTVSM